MKFENLFLQKLNLIFSNNFMGLNLYDFVIIFSLFIFAILVRGLFAKFIVTRIKKFFYRTQVKLDDYLFEALIPPFKLLPVVAVFFFIGLYLSEKSSLGNFIQKINLTLSTLFIFWLFHQSIIPLSKYIEKFEELLSKASIVWIIKSTKYLIIFLGVAAILDIWGIEIGPIIAGLGLFGVAVALGAQDLFKNLISGIMILMEKRFHIGDVIKVPNHCEGTVEHIGFRSTLIRKFDSTPITIPNYIFAEAPILNYTNRINRRINWVVGLEYNSTLDQIKNFTDHIRNYINASQNFIVDKNFKAFIRLEKFNDSSIDILIYCFTSTNDWEKFLEIKENLAMEIKRKVEELNLNFAYPSQSIYIEKN